MTSRKPRAMTARITVVVTEEIIDQAVRKNSTSCLVSDALKIAVPGGVKPQTDLQTISISVPEKGLRYYWLTPRRAQALLINFDHGAQLFPTEFQLTKGWTTPILKGRGGKHGEKRLQRFTQLEEAEANGTLTGNQKRALETMRETNNRDTRPKGKADRSYRPPAATLSNRNGREYGLRLTKLTEHGELLIDQQSSDTESEMK